jgi:hypothetical protein
MKSVPSSSPNQDLSVDQIFIKREDFFRSCSRQLLVPFIIGPWLGLGHSLSAFDSHGLGCPITLLDFVALALSSLMTSEWSWQDRRTMSVVNKLRITISNVVL